MIRAFQLPVRLWGIPLLLDVTFLLVLPLFAFVIGSHIQADRLPFGVRVPESLQVGMIPYALGLIATLGLFISVIIHELGHAITAQGYGVKVKSITLWLLGGVAQFEEMPRQRGAEAVIAIVGPIVSVFVGLFCLAVMWVLPDQLAAARVVLGWLGWMNIFLAVFNMLPALPLDGGRVLRSLLALRMNHLQATRFSAAISKTFAIALGLLGILAFQAGGIWLLLLAFFIYMAVGAETQNSLIVEMLEGIGVRDLMNRDVKTVPPEMPVPQLAQFMLLEHHRGFPVVEPPGRVVGIVTVQNMQGADPNANVGQIMERKLTTVSEDASALDAYQSMSENNFGRLLVTGRDGRMSGIITKTDLMRAIHVRNAGLGPSRPHPQPEQLFPEQPEDDAPEIGFAERP
jgi:Zn-dependent protease/predicted transcriptional regulator